MFAYDAYDGVYIYIYMFALGVIFIIVPRSGYGKILFLRVEKIYILSYPWKRLFSSSRF